MTTWYRELAAGADDLDALAKEMSGNWMKFDSFVWWGRDQHTDPDKWMIFYTHNRDSDVLDESNAHIMAQELEQAQYDADVSVEDHNHWAVGWIKGYAIRCVGEDGKATPAFRQVVKFAERLDSYPILDENHFSDLEHTEAQRVWKDNYDNSDRLAYIRRFRSQFEFQSFADMLGCVRGNYFCGYASELLQP